MLFNVYVIFQNRIISSTTINKKLTFFKAITKLSFSKFTITIVFHDIHIFCFSDS